MGKNINNLHKIKHIKFELSKPDRERLIQLSSHFDTFDGVKIVKNAISELCHKLELANLKEAKIQPPIAV